MLTIDEMVAKAKQDGGSDIHIICGLPPKYRVSGGLENMCDDVLTEEDCSRLFDRFYRGDKARDREKQNGYGIGLSIAQAVAARHGGTAAARLTQEGTLKIRLTVPLDR